MTPNQLDNFENVWGRKFTSPEFAEENQETNKTKDKSKFEFVYDQLAEKMDELQLADPNYGGGGDSLQNVNNLVNAENVDEAPNYYEGYTDMSSFKPFSGSN